MINLDFIKPGPEHISGFLDLNIGADTLGFTPPMQMQIINNVDKSIKWTSSPLYPNMWSRYFEPANCSTIVKDSKGDIVKHWNWDTLSHGDSNHVNFFIWAVKNIGSKGIAIGTNDGTTGEWVVPVRSGLLDAVLVEASLDTFSKLVNNYKDLPNVRLDCNLVTAEGGECIFFESENSDTNSVCRDHVEKFENFNSSKVINEVRKQSISLNDLIITNGLQNDLKWLHVDVEGIDDYLIMSLDESRVALPEVIIYEILNLSPERKNEVTNWLESKNYRCEDNGWNAMAVKNSI